MRKNRFYEETLPEGYREAFTADAGDRKLGSRLAAATMLTNAVLFFVLFLSRNHSTAVSRFSASAFIFSRIASQARARWLHSFFSSAFISAKVLPMGS